MLRGRVRKAKAWLRPRCRRRVGRDRTPSDSTSRDEVRPWTGHASARGVERDPHDRRDRTAPQRSSAGDAIGPADHRQECRSARTRRARRRRRRPVRVWRRRSARWLAHDVEARVSRPRKEKRQPEHGENGGPRCQPCHACPRRRGRSAGETSTSTRGPPARAVGCECVRVSRRGGDDVAHADVEGNGHYRGRDDERVRKPGSPADRESARPRPWPNAAASGGFGRHWLHSDQSGAEGIGCDEHHDGPSIRCFGMSEVRPAQATGCTALL